MHRDFDKYFIDLSEKKKLSKETLFKISAILENSIKKNMVVGGRWSGSGSGLFDGGSRKWDGLAKSTKRQYMLKGIEPLSATLNRNRALMDSIEVNPRNGQIVFSANRPYAAIHQFGGIISHPGGTPYIVLGEKGARFISKKKEAKLRAKKGFKEGSIKYTGPHKIKMPARPYMVLQKADENMIVEIAMKDLGL